jgi:UDP-N-acetylmuramate dehydrogenase
MNQFEELKNVLPEIKENISLKDYSTFRIGGMAKYFLIAKNKEELKIAIKKARELKIPFKLLGAGSNTLIDSNGFDGLVIVFKSAPKSEDFIIQTENDFCVVQVEAPWPLFFLVKEAERNSLTGLEWAVMIPGTLGGAINGNAGAFGQSMGEQVVEVEVLEINNDSIQEKVLQNQDCDFRYRFSVFKNNPNLLILSAKIKLKKGDEKAIKEQIKENLAHRQGKHPKGFSVGSIFKNYAGEISEAILNEYPDLKNMLSKGQVPAGYLIDQCGLKGKTIGGAKVSDEHANFIINNNNASSDDVLMLIDLIKKEVQNKFGIVLEEEIKKF